MNWQNADMGDVERATALKDEGNVAFKAAEYSKAISLYSRAIATAPQVAALYGYAPLIIKRHPLVVPSSTSPDVYHGAATEKWQIVRLARPSAAYATRWRGSLRRFNDLRASPTNACVRYTASPTCRRRRGVLYPPSRRLARLSGQLSRHHRSGGACQTRTCSVQIVAVLVG